MKDRAMDNVQNGGSYKRMLFAHRVDTAVIEQSPFSCSQWCMHTGAGNGDKSYWQPVMCKELVMSVSQCEFVEVQSS
jgi:hypothetical protein